MEILRRSVRQRFALLARLPGYVTAWLLPLSPVGEAALGGTREARRFPRPSAHGTDMTQTHRGVLACEACNRHRIIPTSFRLIPVIFGEKWT